MQTEICRQLDIEFPIFAFTHCRDVVAAVSKAGGFGVLGAVGFPAEQLEIELNWIDEHVGDRPYGVDIVLPNKYEGAGESDIGALTAQLQDMIPEEHRTFVKKVLADHGVPELPDDAPDQGSGLLGWTSATAQPQVDVAMAHDKVRLLANALGTPPPDIVEQVHDSGRLVGALCGTPAQASRHKAAGLDFVIAQGYEAGGHTGDIGSMVLWPQVIDEVAPLPVLAAGGIGDGRQMAAALALGAQGVWTGSLWVAVEEAATSPTSMEAYLEATSKDTVRTRSFTGKPARMLRNEWTEAWERDDTPDPLGMPLQFMIARENLSRTGRYPEAGKDVAFNPVGQIVGTMNKVRKSKDVIYEMVEECIEATERLDTLLGTSDG